MSEELKCEPRSPGQTGRNTKLEVTKRQKGSEESSELLWGRYKGRQGKKGQEKPGKVNINCMFILTWVISSLRKWRCGEVG